MYAWDEFLTEQEKEFGKETVDRWLRPLTLTRFDACNLYLEAQDTFQLAWFEEHIRPKLKNFANNNNSPISVSLTLNGPKDTPKEKAAKVKARKQFETPSFSLGFEELDPSHTFDEFIISHENLIVYKLLEEMTLTLSKRKLEQLASGMPNSSFSLSKDAVNPIFLYGPEGTGKTHLLMACAQKLKSLGYHVIYARAELFTEHVVRAIRAAEMAKVRELYRKVDILIIDDVHELAKKAATQEEFFHTFNTLHTAGKQIILSANIAPQSLKQIEPRLVSRFEWGISLPLYPLEKKEVIQLLEKRAKFFNFPLNARIGEFLAESFPSNLQRAMRAMQALMLRTHLNHKNSHIEKAAPPITLATARNMIADLIEDEKSRKLTPEKIIQAVAEFYGVRTDDVIGKSQSRESTGPRQLSMYVCRHLLKLPYMKIGDLFSRDHSTVMSACRQVEKSLKCENADLRHALASIEQTLQLAPPVKTT